MSASSGGCKHLFFAGHYCIYCGVRKADLLLAHYSLPWWRRLFKHGL